MSLFRKRRQDSHITASVFLREQLGTTTEKLVILGVACAIGGFLFWAQSTELDELALCGGRIVPKEDVHLVQSRRAGTIKSILVEEGGDVSAQQVIVELEDQEYRSELHQNRKRLKALRAKLRSTREEVAAKKKLVKEGLVPRLSLLPLERTLSDLTSERDIAQEAIRENERLLEESKIRAPTDGKVQAILVSKQSSVVRASQDVLQIVPMSSELLAEVQIAPMDIGHVEVGQSALIKLSAYDFNRYGGVEGELVRITPTTELDATGTPFYQGTVRLSQQRLGEGDQSLPILAGMTLNAEIHTGRKSIMQYLMKPVYQSADRALRER